MDFDRPTLLERLFSLLLRKPGDRGQLIQLLRSAHERKLLDADALSITESALAASEIIVRDVMVPRARMEVVDIEDSLDEIVERINRTAHSRFPVIEGSRDNVIGILLSKDLLRLPRDGAARLRDWLHPVVFIPESKRLNVLLREFRLSRNHMGIVVDEYAGVSGLVTIEDVLEQIVGDIEDEYDSGTARDDIREDPLGHYRVKAQTTIEDFNAKFGAGLSGEDCDTIGGFILNRLGRVPRRKERIDIDDLRLTVLRADSQRLYTLLVTHLPMSDAAG
ncbi:MAG: CBS domain-containing protein [Candidatus Accumulibacter sp.]|jgi:magnesium and cobalt transporter|nr:CBS domain-containing protein [Accumulibacter sp.]